MNMPLTRVVADLHCIPSPLPTLTAPLPSWPVRRRNSVF